jgi:predicted membrane chloride channel (bestrophin family)
LEHRAEGRVAANLRGIFFSGIVRQLKTEVSLVACVATVLVLYNNIVAGHIAEGYLAGFTFPELSLPALPFTLSSPALGLLLVFRTNASYGRWLEARTLWARIVSNANNIVRMAVTFVEDPASSQLDRLATSTWLLTRTFMNALSGPEDEDDYQNEVRRALGSAGPENGTPLARSNLSVDPPCSDNLADRILSTSPNRVMADMVGVSFLSAPSRTIAALVEVSLALDAIPIDEKRRVEIDKSIVILGDCWTACDKIYSSPVPLVYTRHTARFLSLWMILLPAALYDMFSVHTGFFPLQGLIVIPAVSIVALFLFGIEELAVQLEEPFSILPMKKFCDGVQDDAQRMIDWRRNPNPITPFLCVPQTPEE